MEVLEADKRPVAAVADHFEIRNVAARAHHHRSFDRAGTAARSRPFHGRAHFARTIQALTMSHDENRASRDLDEKILAHEKYIVFASRLTNFATPTEAGSCMSATCSAAPTPQCCSPTIPSAENAAADAAVPARRLYERSTPGLLEACAGTIDPGEAPGRLHESARRWRKWACASAACACCSRPLSARRRPTEKLYCFVAPYTAGGPHRRRRRHGGGRRGDRSFGTPFRRGFAASRRGRNPRFEDDQPAVLAGASGLMD